MSLFNAALTIERIVCSICVSNTSTVLEFVFSICFLVTGVSIRLLHLIQFI
jgi:hypothetical protein